MLISLFATGCRVVQQTAEIPGKTVSLVTPGSRSEPAPVDPVELQQTVTRLADEFSARTIVSIDKLQRGTNALGPAQILQWKIGLVTETCAIVSGPNPLVNLVDLTVFVTVARAGMEDYWQPKIFGASARPLLENWRNSETNLWRYTDQVLTLEQRTELHAAIETWRRQNPLPEGVLAARAVGFATQAAAAGGSGPARPSSLFHLLMLDPLAGMDPAVREIAQSRMFAERALYVTQKLPMLLRWQTELLSVNTLTLPAVQQLVTNSTHLAAAMERFARVSDQLPEFLDTQRQAAIQQVFAGLAAERTNLIASLAADEMKLRGTLGELRQTLEAGTELLKSSDATIQTLDTFLDRFASGPNAPAATTTNTRPFDILDYAVTAKEVTLTIKELNDTIHSLDQAVPQMQQAGAALEVSGNRLLNRLFLVGVGLILVLLAGGVVAFLAYQQLVLKK